MKKEEMSANLIVASLLVGVNLFLYLIAYPAPYAIPALLYDMALGVFFWFYLMAWLLRRWLVGEHPTNIGTGIMEGQKMPINLNSEVAQRW